MRNLVNVCSACFADEALQEFIRENSDACECSYCGQFSGSPIAVDIREVGAYMAECLGQEYDAAAKWLPHESSEGGFQGDHFDTYDLLTEEIELDLPNDRRGTLLSDLVDAIGNQDWCPADPFGPGTILQAQLSWDRFAEIVIHERRYFFHQVGLSEASEASPPAKTLEKIYEFGEDTGLVRTLPVRTSFVRVRGDKQGVVLSGPDALGPPSRVQARSEGRMNPAGVVVMYVSDSVETASAETAGREDSGNRFFGVFETLRGITLFDLSELPSIPSLFARVPDHLSYWPRQAALFLRSVIPQMSKPVSPDDRVHLEYIPTQVVAEFLRHRQSQYRELDGIAYRSAVQKSGVSYVLFAERQNIVGTTLSEEESRRGSDVWLRLVDEGSLPMP